MVFYLPESVDTVTGFDELTPRQIVAELDKHVVGQAEAKRSVAVALRNRIRRQKLSEELAEEILPKNIIMIGPTAWARRKSPGGWRAWPIRLSSRWKLPGSRKWATWVGTSNP